WALCAKKTNDFLSLIGLSSLARPALVSSGLTTLDSLYWTPSENASSACWHTQSSLRAGGRFG
uniref:hypothetical protein n=1 Tax=Orrella sp. TaxID=1921583 RepID=UPI0040479A03